MSRSAQAVAMAALTAGLVLWGAGSAHAQDPTATLPDGDTVPTWIFIWTLGLGSTIIGALLTALRVLWTKMNAGEKALREHYEGSLETPDKGVLPQLRAAHAGELRSLRNQQKSERTGLRTQAGEWRTRSEQCEVGRREDTERMRQEERGSLKDGLTAMKDVTAALTVSSAKMDKLIVASGFEVEDEDEEGT